MHAAHGGAHMRTGLLVLALLAACDSDPDQQTGVAPDAPQCAAGMPCEAEFTCETADERCTCTTYSSSAFCEPIACPATTVEPGTACTQVGLRCDPDFEFAGYECIGPENVWVACEPGGTIDSRCPFREPVAGAPCCWTDGLQLDPCPYGDTSYSCVNDHWQVM
jgi:hypothetical protein